jgi:hypothetical protein
MDEQIMGKRSALQIKPGECFLGKALTAVCDKQGQRPDMIPDDKINIGLMVIRKPEPPGNGLCHVSASLLMSVKVDPTFFICRAGCRLADIVEKNGKF